MRKKSLTLWSLETTPHKWASEDGSQNTEQRQAAVGQDIESSDEKSLSTVDKSASVCGEEINKLDMVSALMWFTLWQKKQNESVTMFKNEVHWQPLVGH